jgi:hypothetical protein
MGIDLFKFYVYNITNILIFNYLKKLLSYIHKSCWPVKFAANVTETPAPTETELKELRALHARTAAAHGEAA